MHIIGGGEGRRLWHADWMLSGVTESGNWSGNWQGVGKIAPPVANTVVRPIHLASVRSRIMNQVEPKALSCFGDVMAAIVRGMEESPRDHEACVAAGVQLA